MSRLDRMIARRLESARRPRVVRENAGPGRRTAVLVEGVAKTTSASHRTGNAWWRARFADVVERRSSDTTKKVEPTVVKPAPSVPERLSRPPGMSRQIHRRLFREACKKAGVPWRAK